MANGDFVSSDYLKLAAARAQAFKQRSFDLLALQPGQQVLDVGCGPGIDTCALAAWVGDSGTVYGVDIDPAMIAEADARAQQQAIGNVRHQLADVLSLPFADQSLDAVRAERLLQVLPDSLSPTAVIAEMRRVLKPGGRLLLADADWGSASVDMQDTALERRLTAFFATRMRPNGLAGRQLYRGLQHAGFSELTLEITPFVHRDLALLPFGEPLTNKALAAGVISAAEAQAWLAEIADRLRDGSFLATVNLVIVTGCR